MPFKYVSDFFLRMNRNLTTNNLLTKVSQFYVSKKYAKY